MRINRFFYLLKEGIKSIFTHGFMSFASVTIIAACLIIMGSFSLLAVNIDALINDLEEDNEILAFVDEELDDISAKAIQTRLEAIENVRSVEFVTRDQAMTNFIAQYDESEATMFDDLTPSVFRHRYVIYLNDLSLMEQTRDAIANVSGIADVNAQIEVSRGFITVRNVVSVISVILIVILFCVSVFIMQNTVKLATYSRKEEIGIMKVVGAGNSFIRFPFVVEGTILGLLGGAIGFFAEWGLYQLVIDKVMSGMIANLVTVVPFDVVKIPILIVFLAIGFVVGTFGSNIAIRNYLKV